MAAINFVHEDIQDQMNLLKTLYRAFLATDTEAAKGFLNSKTVQTFGMGSIKFGV